MGKNETRLAAIEALPTEMQEAALVDWRTVATLLNLKDEMYARDILIAAGIPLVQVTARRRLPRWGDLKTFLEKRAQAV